MSTYSKLRQYVKNIVLYDNNLALCGMQWNFHSNYHDIILLHNSSRYKKRLKNRKQQNSFALLNFSYRHFDIEEFHDYDLIKQFSSLLQCISYLDACCFFFIYETRRISNNNNNTMTQTRQKRDSFKILFSLLILLIKCKILKSFRVLCQTMMMVYGINIWLCMIFFFRGGSN